MAVSVEASAFIAIDRNSREGFEFDSHCRPGSFLRFNSWPVIYDAVGSLASCEVFGSVDLGSIPARAIGFNRVITLSKLCTYTCALDNQAIHPSGSVNLQFIGGNCALRSVRVVK